jgi:hypothetical protein
MRTCIKCKHIIPVERLEVLPETHTCVNCSGVQKYCGVMVYEHKTAPTLVYIRPENKEAVEQLTRYVNRARR